jgi:ABC-type nitrate/sulfonate/bicarbonate transport system permease component
MSAEPVTLKTDRQTSDYDAGVAQRIFYFFARPTVIFPAIAFVVFIALWQWMSTRIDPLLFPSPWRVVTAYQELITSGQLWPALLTTLQTLAIGFAISAVFGLVLGVLTGRIPLLHSILNPYIEAIYATPRVVIIPLIILWFGVGDTGRLFLVFFGTFIPIMINTSVGIQNAREDLIEVGKAFGANERELVRHAILPGAIPYIIAGMRVAIGRALIGVVIAEIFLDLTGLGGMIQTDLSYFRVDRMIAVVLIYSALGTILMALMGKIEQRFSVWR